MKQKLIPLDRPTLSFISQYIKLDDLDYIVLSSKKLSDISSLEEKKYNSIINISSANYQQRINKFFEAVNNKLPNGGYFVGSTETYYLRNKYLSEKYSGSFGLFIVNSNFIINRVLPKLMGIKAIYFFFTRGKRREISEAELLGRLIRVSSKTL